MNLEHYLESSIDLGSVQVATGIPALAGPTGSPALAAAAGSRPGPGYESRSDLRAELASEAGHRPGPFDREKLIKMHKRPRDC